MTIGNDLLSDTVLIIYLDGSVQIQSRHKRASMEVKTSWSYPINAWSATLLDLRRAPLLLKCRCSTISMFLHIQFQSLTLYQYCEAKVEFCSYLTKFNYYYINITVQTMWPCSLVWQCAASYLPLLNRTRGIYMRWFSLGLVALHYRWMIATDDTNDLYCQNQQQHQLGWWEKVQLSAVYICASQQMWAWWIGPGRSFINK